MNAVEKANSLEITSKIATIVNLFKLEYPDFKVDLKPWMNDANTRELVDPDSIDMGFHFPGQSRLFRVRSILVQIRLYEDPVEGERKAIGVEATGYDHKGQQWRFSTVDNWSFVGITEPTKEAGDKLRYLCRQVLDIFNRRENPL
jgi:hypothetical protein